MSVDIATDRYTADYEGVTYYFYSAHCQRTFIENPRGYVNQPGATTLSSPTQ